MPNSLLNSLPEHDWKMLAVRGALGILFGCLALAWPLETIWVLAIFWGAYAFVDGLFALGHGWKIRHSGKSIWPYALFGLTGLAAGVITLLWPAITALALVFVIAFWAILGGLSQIMTAIRLHKSISGEWLLGLAGLVGLIFGIIIIIRPIPEGMVMIAWFVAFYALVTGVIYLMTAFRIRSASR